MATLLLSGPQDALAETPKTTIHLACPPEVSGGFCDALGQAITEAFPATRLARDGMSGAGTDVAVEFHLARQTPNLIAGRLSWTDGAGRTGTGPVVELTVMDAEISEPVLRSFAHDLIRHSELDW
jgi:hypothetical protein